jgi:hypothetical protein
MMRLRVLPVLAVPLLLAASFLVSAAPRPPATFTADKGSFRILVGGQPIGKEDFEITANGAGWIVRGTSTLQAGTAMTRVTGTLELRADGTPVRYEWSSMGDKNASSAVVFDGPIASVEPNKPGDFPYTQQFTFGSVPVVVLDNNLYDQYAVLARLYDWSKKGEQTFSIFVPQELTGGTATVESAGTQEIEGKKLEQLRVKTEDLEVNLFLDGQRLVRIAAPASNAEIIRQ